MKLLAGLVGSFVLLVYMAFMANDTSRDMYSDLPNEDGSEKRISGNDQLNNDSNSRAPASTPQKSKEQKQEELLKRQQNSARNVAQSNNGLPDRGYDERDDYDKEPLQRRESSYNRMNADSSGSSRSLVRQRRSNGIGSNQVSPRPSSGGGRDISSGSGDPDGSGTVVITGGGFDPSCGCFRNDPPPEGPTSPPEDPSSSPPGGGGGGSGGGTNLSCQASEQGGTFSNPLSVELSCNATASIRYCLTESSTCCDPDGPDSQVYDPSDGVLMGMENSDYCLSYYGDSNDLSQVTEIESYTYTFNSDFPELNVEHSNRWVQSTQINENAEFTSGDFGKAEHYLGQMNYLTNDITDPTLDASCYDMALNNMGFASPSPTEPLPLMEVTSLASTDKVNTYYSPDNLDYIENHIFSYIVNDSFEVPLISCQISTVTLEDFHVTDSAPHHLSTLVGVGQIQGQFTPYGFFEETLEPTRSPAGESNNEVDGRELRTNFLSMLYQ